MKLKSLLLAFALCLAGSTLASAKSRTFTIDKQVQCGNLMLPPGTYRLTLRSDTAEITDLNHFAEKDAVKVAATRSRGDQKFDHTAVLTDETNGNYRVTEIDLGHSTTAVQFPETQ